MTDAIISSNSIQDMDRKFLERNWFFYHFLSVSGLFLVSGSMKFYLSTMTEKLSMEYRKDRFIIFFKTCLVLMFNFNVSKKKLGYPLLEFHFLKFSFKYKRTKIFVSSYLGFWINFLTVMSLISNVS